MAIFIFCFDAGRRELSNTLVGCRSISSQYLPSNSAGDCGGAAAGVATSFSFQMTSAADEQCQTAFVKAAKAGLRNVTGSTRSEKIEFKVATIWAILYAFF